MANGDKLKTIYDLADDGLLTTHEFSRIKFDGGRGIYDLFQALDDQDVVDDGVWVDIRGWSRSTPHFSDLGTGTCEVYGAVGNASPATNNTTNYLVATFTTVSNADVIATIDDRLDWVRVRKSAAGDTLDTNCVWKASH